MLPAAQLPTVLVAIPPSEYRQVLFRLIPPPYLSSPQNPLSGSGSRYSPSGAFDTLYLAEDPETAFHEFQHICLEVIAGLDDPFAARLATTAFLAPQVILPPTSVLDLTRREVRTALGTNLLEITSPWRVPLPPTHVLGQVVFASRRFQAIRFPSARRPGGVCLALFTTRLLAGSSISLDDSRHGGQVVHLP